MCDAYAYGYDALLAGIGLEKTGNPKCNPMLEGLTADSEEKHEPASDIRQCSGG
jgi:hypothetical protein